MSDGMTDRRSQPDYAAEYLRQDTAARVISDSVAKFRQALLSDPEMMAAMDEMTLAQLRRVEAMVRRAVGESVSERVVVR